MFSGGGGFARGFLEAGYTVELAVEKDPFPAYTYIRNISPDMIFIKDIRRIHSQDIIRSIEKYPDVVIASPPCEAFTMASRNIMEDPLDRLYTDPRGRLTLEAVRIIGDLQPKVFVIENVPGITKKPIPDYIREEFRRVGYEEIHFNKLNAVDYGNPSHRRRIFISNIKLRPRKRRGAPTVWNAIGDLPDPRLHDEIPNHQYVNPPKRFENRIRRVRWGEALEYFRGGMNREYKQYIRLHPDKQAPTIMGKSRFIHPYQDRFLTVREQARLMGYPDNHIFIGPLESQYNQVGESVPPPLAKAIAEYIKEYLSATSSSRVENL